MDNPGLKKHVSPPSSVPTTPFLTVTSRRRSGTRTVVSAPPPMATPRTQGGGGYTVPPEPATLRQNVMTAPGPTGVATSPPVQATNGAAPILDYQPISATQPQADPNKPANQRRIDTQKQVGGGAKENPAWEQAQNRVQEKVQRRRAHPLHQSAFDRERNEWTYDVDDPDYFEDDPAPSKDDGHAGDLYSLKVDHPYTHAPQLLDDEDTVEPGLERWTTDQYRQNDGTRQQALDRVGFEEAMARMRARDQRLATQDEERDSYGQTEVAPEERDELKAVAALEDIGINEEDNLRHFVDDELRPRDPNSHQNQPMIEFKKQYSPVYPEMILDPGFHSPGETCETCYLKWGSKKSPDEAEHWQMDHPFKPFVREHNERYSALIDTTELYEDDDVDTTGLRNFMDTNYQAPFSQATTSQPMFQIKVDPNLDEHGRMGDPYRYSPNGENNCETCWLKNEGTHHGSFEEREHPFKPFAREHNERYSHHTHPLHQSAYDDRRRQFLHDIDADPDYYLYDKPPSAYGHGDQPMFQIKEPLDHNGRLRMEEPHHHPSWLGCQNCLNMNEEGDLYGPDNALHQRDISGGYEHEYKPIEDLPAGVRLAHHDPDQDIKDVLAVQGSPGNWDYDPYMQGMYNGMELVGAIHDGRDPEFKSPPGIWGHERAALKAEASSRLSALHPVKIAARYQYSRFTPDPEGMKPGEYTDHEEELSGPFYHGSRSTRLKSGDHLTTNRKTNSWGDEGDRSQWVHITTDLDGAHSYAKAAGGHVYEVEPTGVVRGGYGGGDYKTKDPVRVLRRVTLKAEAASQETDDEFWARQPDVESSGSKGQAHQMGGEPPCETCYLRGFQYPDWPGRKTHDIVSNWPGHEHPYKPITMEGNERYSAVHPLHKRAETDDDFWARMEQEYPGQQPPTQPWTYLSPDSFVQEHQDSPPEHEFVGRWQDDDDVTPDNMSLRDHSRLLNSGIMNWDGDTRYPKYTHNVHRAVVDSDGNPAYAQEGHVIEHNTHHQGPALPTADNPEPHVLEYPWSHTYYPAGMSDSEGLTRGYNSPDAALKAVTQLSLHGARHPQSAGLLKDYKYVDSDEKYDPAVELPHERVRERL